MCFPADLCNRKLHQASSRITHLQCLKSDRFIQRFFLPFKCRNFTNSKTALYQSFENIVGKGENAGNQHFLLFPQCLHPDLRNYYSRNIEFVAANALNLVKAKMFLFGNVF